MTKQARELPDSFASEKLPTEIVSLIASYEDKNISLDRMKALFNFFCPSFSSKDPVAILPYDISLTIFSYLNGNGLGRSYEVSKGWSTFISDSTLWDAFDLKKISPRLKVFDESDWVTHVDLSSFGLSIEDAPPLDKGKAIPFLKRALFSLPIEGNAGVTVLTIPKGLTFNKLVRLAQSPKKGDITQFVIWERISSEMGDIAVDQTYRIGITNNVFEKSRNLSASDQKALVDKIGCEMPKVLEAMVLLVVTFMRSERCLYSNNPLTYTRCMEQIDGSQLVVEWGGSSAFEIIGSYFFVSILFGVGGRLAFDRTKKG